MNATVTHARTGDHALTLSVAMHAYVNLDSTGQNARVRYQLFLYENIFFVPKNIDFENNRKLMNFNRVTIRDL